MLLLGNKKNIGTFRLKRALSGALLYMFFCFFYFSQKACTDLHLKHKSASFEHSQQKFSWRKWRNIYVDIPDYFELRMHSISENNNK